MGERGKQVYLSGQKCLFATGDANSKDWKPNQFDKTAVDVESDEKPAANYQH